MAQEVSNIAQVRALATPAKAYLWEFIIPQVPAAAGAVPEALTFRARVAQFPGRSVGEIITNFKGHKIKHPGRNNFTQTLNVSFEEGMNGVVIQALRNWFNAWLNEQDGSSQGEEAVKVDAFVRILNHDQSVVLQGHIYGFFIQNMPDIALDYSQEALLTVQATFGFDYWELE